MLDGLSVLRTDLKPEALDATVTVSAYKDLATVARAFRGLESIDLEVRPIQHRRAQHVPAHGAAVHARLLSRIASAPGAQINALRRSGQSRD
jgi:hypothetical protein